MPFTHAAVSPWQGSAPNVWYAEAEGRIVGQYAGTPMRIQVDGRIVPTVHTCDVMTAADFRKQGVLTEEEFQKKKAELLAKI